MHESKIFVFRMRHRHKRDKRVTTHLFLAARAFGANESFYSGKKDLNLELSISKVQQSWGGRFQTSFIKNWKKAILEWKKQDFEVIHLTMYGIPVHKVISRIRNSRKDKIVVVGGAKVPGLIYELADWNISITSQPHSEISALSVFLHELFQGKELTGYFENSKLKIVPKRVGKEIIKVKR